MMKMRTTRIISYAVAMLFLFFASCGNKAESEEAADPVAASSASSRDRIKIKTPDERNIVELQIRDDETRIEFESNGQPKMLRGRLKETGKRKYEHEGGGQVAEVKSDDDSFKVRTPDGSLLWKVKLSADKIKISDNEEGNNPFVLEVKGPERVNVLQDTNEIGKVNFYPDRGKVKVKNASEEELFESNTNRFSALYGVLLMSRVRETERFIIMAELMARGR